jgi:hypothetical protein
LERRSCLVRVCTLSTVKRGQTPREFLVELAQLGGTGQLVFFQKAKSLPDHFASGVVAASLNLGVDELLKFGGERV